jgi:hypothetical protein
MSTSIAMKIVPTAMMGMSISMRRELTSMSIPTPTGTISTITSVVTDVKLRVR